MTTALPIVFVVDDDESVRKALARLIGSVGLEVQTFASPAAFLAHARPDRPACLILDMRMPDTSGLTFQEELARASTDLPILFLTGHADVSTSVRAMKAGAVDFLEKPVNDQALLDAVQRALGRARELRAARSERDGIARRVATLTPREREVVVKSYAETPEEVTVSVEDVGPPVAEATLEAMFTPFHTTKPEGLGMGLAISRSIVEAHGGRLWAARREERGLVVTFTLPVPRESGA